MSTEFKQNQGVTIAVLSGTLDKTQGEEFAKRVEQEIPRGGKLVVDGTHLQILTQQGVLQLMAAQRWTSAPERKRLLLTGFSATVWRAIVENGSDFFFDSKPSLAEALRAVGATLPDSAEVGPTTADPVPAVTPRISAPLVREAASPTPSSKVSVPPASFQGQPSLAKPRPTPPNTPPVWQPPKAGASIRSTPPRHWPRWAISAAALIAVAVVGWWMLGSRPPTLALSAASTVVEEDGMEPDEITVRVAHGRLSEQSLVNLPKGLYFEPPSDDASPRVYTLRGKADPGTTTATVQLRAANDSGQMTTPIPFTVNVKEKPMAWQLNTLQSIGLKVGHRIWATSKFLVNADRAQARSGLPPGLAVEHVPGTTRDWQLSGTPTEPGSYPVVFTAVSPAGRQEEHTCTLAVSATEPPTPTPTPEPASASDSFTVNETPAPAYDTTKLDDGMRYFLLTRIENLPSHYNDKERENLRTVVGTLRQAQRIYRVVFERDGQTNLSDDQNLKLKEALEGPANAQLLRDPACQIVIVGYASRTGSLGSNVQISKLRARAVNDALRKAIGRNADLCGDYGPTNVLDQAHDEQNRAVEIFAGILKPSPDMQAIAARFKQEFNRTHGIR